MSLSLLCLHPVEITSIITTTHPSVTCLHIHADSHPHLHPPFCFLTSSILSRPYWAASPSSILCLLIHYFVFCLVSILFSSSTSHLLYLLLPPTLPPFFCFIFVCFISFVFVIFGYSKSHSFCPCSIRASTSPDPVSVATNTLAATGNLPQSLSPPPPKKDLLLFTFETTCFSLYMCITCSNNLLWGFCQLVSCMKIMSWLCISSYSSCHHIDVIQFQNYTTHLSDCPNNFLVNILLEEGVFLSA